MAPSDSLSLLPDNVADWLSSIRPGSKVADIGCHGWRLDQACQASGHKLLGFDLSEPPDRPDGVGFEIMEGCMLICQDGLFDAVVASHVIEHMDDPVGLACELSRVLAPSGIAWIEAPSELSCLPTSSATVEDHRFCNFWDDPTHKRPYTPAALYRLVLSAGLYPLACGHVDDGIPSSRILARKPASMGRVSPRYVTLRACPEGAESAWHYIWPEFVLSNKDKMLK